MNDSQRMQSLEKNKISTDFTFNGNTMPVVHEVVDPRRTAAEEVYQNEGCKHESHLRCQRCQSLREVDPLPEIKRYAFIWGSCEIRISSVILCDSCKSNLFAKITEALLGDKK